MGASGKVLAASDDFDSIVTSSPLFTADGRFILRRVKQLPEQLKAGSEVVVETPFGTYRGVLAHVQGTDVHLRCLGHDICLNRHALNDVRVVGTAPGERAPH
jgi:hypothetical protein